MNNTLQHNGKYRRLRQKTNSAFRPKRKSGKPTGSLELQVIDTTAIIEGVGA
jgi:hypothetical protein